MTCWLTPAIPMALTSYCTYRTAATAPTWLLYCSSNGVKPASMLRLSVEPESVYYGEDGWLEVDLGITGWGSRPYPQFYLDIMLVSGGAWNEAHFSDEEFDALAALAGTTLDDDERIEAYAQIQQLLAERGPIIIPYYFAQFGAINEAFNDGFAMKAFAGRTDVTHIVYTP